MPTRTVPAALCAAAIAIAISAAPAVAQGLPQGSYLDTCTNVRVAANELLATCRMQNQTQNETALANPFNCQGWISNQNGTLVCGRQGAQPYVPPPASVAMRMAKFESACAGPAFAVIRVGGSPDNVIRFTLGAGQKVHFQLPDGSTISSQCDSWPTGGFDHVNFD
jgi:hypothetical protein